MVVLIGEGISVEVKVSVRVRDREEEELSMAVPIYGQLSPCSVLSFTCSG